MGLPIARGEPLNEGPSGIAVMARSLPGFVAEGSITAIGEAVININFRMILVPIEGFKAVGPKGISLESSSRDYLEDRCFLGL